MSEVVDENTTTSAAPIVLSDTLWTHDPETPGKASASSERIQSDTSGKSNATPVIVIRPMVSSPVEAVPANPSNHTRDGIWVLSDVMMSPHETSRWSSDTIVPDAWS